MSKYFQPNSKAIGNDLYVLLEDCKYEWVPNGKPDICSSMCVWAGFVYDGNSIPRFIWNIFDIDPGGEYRIAVILHDWLYTNSGDLPENSVTRIIKFSDGSEKCLNTFDKWTRKDADKFLKKVLLETTILSKLKVQLIYYVVRIFGWTRWRLYL